MFTALKVRSKACEALTLAAAFIRIGQKNPKYPDFKNKTADEALWLDSAPHYVIEKLDGLTFNSGYNAAKTYKPFNSSIGKGKTLNIIFSLFVLIFDTNIQYKQQVRIQFGVNSRQAKLPLLRNRKRKVGAPREGRAKLWTTIWLCLCLCPWYFERVVMYARYVCRHLVGTETEA